jgi:hypothetical protein
VGHLYFSPRGVHTPTGGIELKELLDADKTNEFACCEVQNPESGGLVSADRKASLLSCLQHPVS